MTDRIFRTLAEAVEAHYEELKRFVLRRSGSPSLAADVVQETWLRATAVGPEMPANPRAYLYRMAGNLTVDQLRREAVRARRDSGEPPPTDIASPLPPPDAVVAAREELAILGAAVQELPARCREVFLLYRGQGLSMRAIAGRLGISEKTVEKHIARAMVHCRRRLDEAGRWS